MDLRVEYVSVNGGSGLMSETFANEADVKRRVPQLMHGLSSYYQVRVMSADAPETVLFRGWRAGPGGTGERWTWRPADGQ